MFPTFRPEIPSHIVSQGLQCVELLVVLLGAAAYAGFRDLAQPFRTVARRVNLLPCTRNSPTPIQCLESIHDAPKIFGDRQITAAQLLQGSNSILSVIDRFEIVEMQQFG